MPIFDIGCFIIRIQLQIALEKQQKTWENIIHPMDLYKFDAFEAELLRTVLGMVGGAVDEAEGEVGRACQAYHGVSVVAWLQNRYGGPPRSKMEMEMKMTGRERREYSDWKSERERIDQSRIDRQLNNSGDWRREWDHDKVEQEWDHFFLILSPPPIPKLITFALLSIVNDILVIIRVRNVGRKLQTKPVLYSNSYWWLGTNNYC